MDRRDLESAWDSLDPAGSELALKRLLPRAKRSGDAALVLELTLWIARAQRLSDAFDAASETLNDAEFQLVHSSLRGGACEVLYLLERADFFQAVGWDEQAGVDRQAAAAITKPPPPAADGGPETPRLP